ncbi:MAG: ribosome biogenesis GTP-binding protein YihA/YsxC [Prevotellaceae bacterium]|nr:ribosome biogenesis GTP-binding protein YihA/YsxC [Prevotellaceae bacterium]
MKIRQAEFVTSSPTAALCPQSDKPEYAFIGRSNVGKSSLINMLTQRKALAKTSATPGKTLLINHFLVNQEWHLVDLPGYGYARRGRAQREQLGQMIEGYILRRQQMACLFLLIDSRHEPQRIDVDFTRWLGQNGVPFAIVFTKADKLSRGKLNDNVRLFLQRMQEEWEELPPHFVTSSLDRTGREELLDYIQAVNSSLKEAQD